MTRWTVPVFIVLSIATLSRANRANKLKQIHSWKSLDFAFPSVEDRNSAISNGDFHFGEIVPIDVDVYYGDKGSSMIFVTIPRFQEGVPATLNYVTDQVTSDGNPILAPFPNWEWNKLSKTCEYMTSVFRVQVDNCGRLWVLDSGKVMDTQICQPQLLLFSMKNNTLLNRYVFPTSQFDDRSLFVTPVVDIRDGKCDEAYVYVADITGFGLLVYDHSNQQSWRIENKLFFPYPEYGTFNIRGNEFDLMDGLIGLALGPVDASNDRRLYFHPFASNVEAYGLTSIIRNSSLFETDAEAHARAFVRLKGERSSQSATEAMDRNGVLFFGLMSDCAIGCWNTKFYPEYGKNIATVTVDRERLTSPTGVKIITDRNGRQELWVMASSFDKLMTGTLTSDVTNFRILAAYTDELVRGTRCNSSRNVVNVLFPK